MAWLTTDRPDVFRAEAGAFLDTRPDLHHVLLSGLDVADYARESGDAASLPVLGWWRDDSEGTTAAFVRTPPSTVATTSLPGSACASLARLLASETPSPGGLVADEATVPAFVDQWQALTGREPEVRPHSRLFRLDTLVQPPLLPTGRARVASATERTLVLDWCEQFVKEAGPLGMSVPAFVDERLAHGGWTVWDVDGEAVAMATRTRTVSGMTRVTCVYAPAEYRGQGYATAVTAASASAAREAGAAHVVLCADPADLKAHRLYQALGFQPAADYRIISLRHP